MKDYAEFLHEKIHEGAEYGIDPRFLPEGMFDFQRFATEWAARKGSGALFMDCGMGKTLIQLAWGENLVRQFNRPVLVMTPLAVAPQTIQEGAKFGMEVRRPSPDWKGLTVTNYERLHHLNPDDYIGAVCDESSSIKAFNGARRQQVTDFLRKIPYRLLCTATAAPNDYTELGTSSEALGEMGLTDMLSRFFKDEQGRGVVQRAWGSQSRWRFKGHSQVPFWRWVCSWARAARKPSDFGFPDDGFCLPPLTEREHIVTARTLAPGMLFSMPASNLQEEREERRRTVQERCEMAATLVASTGKPFVIWCHLNDEGDALARMIPDSLQVSGVDSDEQKEEKFVAFSSQSVRGLIIKPKIGAFGLNWQHCAHIVTFASHSYEQYYQAIRRCWRFGQQSPVTVDIVSAEGESGVIENLQRKSRQADRMFEELVAHMELELKISTAFRKGVEVEVPAWL